MAKKFIFLSFLILGLAAALFIFLGQQEATEASVETVEVEEPQEISTAIEDAEVAPVVESVQEGDISMEVLTREYLEKSMSIPKYDWKQPIEFYGKVVTIDGQPIEGVTVGYGWTSLTGYDTRIVQSDANGLFELTGVRGKSMGVKLEKEGYDWFSNQTQKSFEFAEPYDPEFHKANPDEPLIYYMRKRPEAEPLHAYRGKKQEVFAASNGTFYDYLTGRFSQSSRVTSTIRMTAEVDTPEPNQHIGYNWSLTLEAEGVEFTSSDSVVTSIAPEQEYVKTLVVGSSSEDEAHWSSQRNETIFFRTDEGDFGRLRLIAGVRPETRKVNVRIDSYFNPSGSPVLVFDSRKRIR